MSYKESMIEVIKATGIPENFVLSSPEKISLKSNCAFSLPAGPTFSCPGATAACENCYAMKKRHVFRNVQVAFAKNWRLLNEFERNNDVNGAVELLSSGIKSDCFRTHESGDFSSEFSINVWTNVIRQKPNTLFWAYTRSFNFNFQKIVRLPNFNLFASTDEFNIKEANNFVKRYSKSSVKHAYGPWEHDKELPENSFVCPTLSGKIELKGACERCKLCIIKDRTTKNVIFLKH